MSLLTPLIWILAITPLVIIALINAKKGNLKFLFFFILYFLADSYLQFLSHHFFSLEFIGLKFAWLSKFLSLLLSLIIIFTINKTDREEIGFTTNTNNKKHLKLGVLIFLGFLVFDIIFKLILFPKGGFFDIETFAFQATLPGLTEEIAYRGIQLWMLDKVSPPKWNVKGIKFGWGFIIVTILFGVAHGMALTADYEFKFDIITIIYLTLISSLSLGLLRKFSGNLIYPVLGHNVINILNAIIRIL
ncbi:MULTISPECIES: type II CAAX prenyl endopeptidase Rce1 family protein [unclassified Kaistella]|uniref:CPBP family glutamic-type intramembrane protease n=1 Tax=unclassified Kaistella TaxID=2762626 RepID=UPI0027367F1B|nr:MULTISPECIES: CPBP family glutamic-type intramembrane protease [unclassified Kaistella]MDP2455212.1 CPBP family glutamic-type intramembrane protease [Kaistella sp. SH11-4b]MDP2458059.1 CPBP family glutamic-type intramembrane protease [Kaistella sp. SH40-3]MDP2461026.1 CPBP family glutamic-type intramembrane protease [Kaistella sp. SH19-2b]